MATDTSVSRALAPGTRSNGIEVVLGGGGVKGFGHVGTLKAIEELKIDIGEITGVSIGSAVAALYANGFTTDQICEIFLRELRRISPSLTDRTVRVRNILNGGLIDLSVMFQDIVSRYDLRPQPNLRILAYNVLKRQPVLFEGTRYNLAMAIAASCAVPGVMRPVWFGENDVLSRVRTILGGRRSKVSEGVLVDGGVYHPCPGDLCQRTAIISKLGFATRLPSELLSPVDMVMHLLEMTGSLFMDRLYPDPKRHIVIHTGMPNVAGLTFGISKELCLELVDHGYQQSHRTLAQAISQGRVPLKP